MQPGREDNGAALLVLRVWRDPAFRARLTWGEVDGPSSETLVKSDPDEVVAFVTRWLEEV